MQFPKKLFAVSMLWLMLLPPYASRLHAQSNTTPPDTTWETIIDRKSGKSLMRINTFAPGIIPTVGDMAFQFGDEEIVLTGGLQKSFGDKGHLPDINLCFSDRFPGILKKNCPVQILDNFSLLAIFSLSTPSTDELVKYGAGYVLNAATNKLLGYDAFQLPSISDLFKLATAQGAVTLNLVRSNPHMTPQPNLHFFASLDWALIGIYSPVKAESSLDDFAGVLSEIDKQIQGLTNSLSNPLVSILSGDSIRRDIKRLTNIAGSLKKIPQTVVFKNLKLDYLSDILDDNSDKDVDKGGAPSIRMYTGPTMSLGMKLPGTKAFSLAGYAEYLWPFLSHPKATKQLYVAEESSALDTADNYYRLLGVLGIPVEKKSREVTLQDDYKTKLFVYGFRLTAEFYAINLFVGWQGVQQVSKPHRKGGAEPFKASDGFNSSFSVGGNLNLVNIFRKSGSSTSNTIRVE